MIEVLLLAIALAMDAFAVSIGLGAKSQQQSARYILRLAIYATLYFGIAQGVMPLIGYLLGAALLGWLAAAAPWIGGFILIGLGSKMLYEVFLADEEESVVKGLRVNYEAASIKSSHHVYPRHCHQYRCDGRWFYLKLTRSQCVACLCNHRDCHSCF